MAITSYFAIVIDMLAVRLTQLAMPNAEGKLAISIPNIACVVVLAILTFAAPSNADDPQPNSSMTALVIGNSSYVSFGSLKNPVKDATSIGIALEGLGFDVQLVTNATREEMLSGLRRFGRASRGADVVLVYFAGHGVQLEGENYLIPVGAKISIERDLRYEAVSSSDITEELEAANPQLSVLILDACRDNPLVRSLAGGDVAKRGSTTSTRGLAAIEGARGMLIAYSTAPGHLALDGKGENSPFAEALVEHIDDPGIDIRVMFGRVRQSVLAKTDGYQVPWVEEAVIGEFQFAPGDEATDPNLAAAKAWELVQTNPTRAALERFAERHSESAFADLAASQITALDAEATGEAPTPTAETSSASEAELASLASAASAWRAIGDDADRTALAQFLVEHGDSPFADIALDRLASMVPGRSTEVFGGHPPSLPLMGPLNLPISGSAVPLTWGGTMPYDQDGDPFAVTVEEIPTTGSLETLDGPLVVGSEISEQKLGQLFFRPNRILAGRGKIRLSATDVHGYSSEHEIYVRVSAPKLSTLELRRRQSGLSENNRRQIQRRLKSLELYSGLVDGEFGGATEEAIKNFQAALGAEQTGILTFNERIVLVVRDTAARAFRDCDICPEMIEVPGGSFVMGASREEVGAWAKEYSHGPQRQVTIKPFDLARFELTLREWDRCVADGACRNIESTDAKRGSLPAIAPRADLLRYVEWLRGRTGKDYRLPSEAEWEYAARAGTTTLRYWGNGVGSGFANCGECGDYEWMEWPWTIGTAPVGSYIPNQFGLYDMLGNAEEWVQDCYSDWYRGAPTDGTAFELEVCRFFVLRGGGRSAGGETLTSYYRNSALPREWGGLRIARSRQR